MMRRLAVVGSRDFPYAWMVRTYLDLKAFDELVSGAARGVDTWAADHASLNLGKSVTEFPADWDKHGKSAGFIRNRQIVEYATDVVAFHYGDSKGTAHTIKLAREAGNLREVIHVF